jgi:glyoxylate reductase
MKQHCVFVTRILPGDVLDALQDQCDVTVWQDELPPPPDLILAEIANADGILSLLTDRIDGTVMDAAPNLRVISNMAVGCDNINLDAATRRGLPVGHTPGVLTETTADLAFALLLAAARRLPEGQQAITDGQWKTWSPTQLLGHDVHGATLGIIGLGRIGQAVARRAKGFDMQLLYCGEGEEKAAQQLNAEKCSLADLLLRSDFVSLHVPLKPDTFHMIGATQLALMKPSAVLINTARGGVVDPETLYKALKEQQIWAAALDVTEPEPIPLDDPLLTLDNCLVVPHIGSSSIATREKMARIAVNNLLAGLRGERLPHCINPEVYE